MNAIRGSKCILRRVSQNNFDFIKNLFYVEDIKRYFVLRDDHASNLNEFCNHLYLTNNRGSFNYVIYNLNDKEVGIITAETYIDNRKQLPVWNVAYAVHPLYRNTGYATDALMALSDSLLEYFPFFQIVLDINTENTMSIKVAQNCNFSKPMDGIAYFDPYKPDTGMRFQWIKEIEGANNYNNSNFSARSKIFISQICINRTNKEENYILKIDYSTYTDAIAIRAYDNGGLINQFIFSPNHYNGKIESVAIFGIGVYDFKEIIEKRMKVFGLPVESVEVDNMNNQDFLEVTLEDYNF